jgi:hypothetical protein
MLQKAKCFYDFGTFRLDPAEHVLLKSDGSGMTSITLCSLPFHNDSLQAKRSFGSLSSTRAPNWFRGRTSSLRITDGCRTLISAISDLRNQAATAPQRVGFFERRCAEPI